MTSELLERIEPEHREQIREAQMPDPETTSPMLATLTDDYFDDPEWIFERKLDGERALAFLHNGEAKLRSRNHQHLEDTYPEIAEALRSQARGDLVVDGEIVAFDGDVTSFQRLQARMNIDDPDEARASNVAVWFYVFDLLWLDGCDITGLALRERKKLLRDAIDFDGRIRLTTHRNEEGTAYHEEACEKGWEGVIAKEATSQYVHSRSRKWLKFKCVARQEFVIGGFTEPDGDRVGFGALLVGYYEDGEFHYAGKVGTGYSDEFLEDFRAELDDLEVDESPFDVGEPGDVHFVEPTLVGEVGFTEWTDDGKLRHPRFLGLRDDKAAEDVVRERPS